MTTAQLTNNSASGQTIIRCSSLTGYSDCGRRVAANVFGAELKAAGFDLRETWNGIASAIGTAVHKAASVMLDEKARTGNLPPPNVATDAAVEMVHARAADGVMYDRDTAALPDAERQVIRMTEVYRSDIAPGIEPLLVEERLEANVPYSSQGLVLSGQADVIAREPGRVRDLKTSTRAGANHNPQIGGYSLLARTQGIQVHEAGIDLILRVSVKKPQPAAISTRHEIAIVEQSAASVLRRIDADLKAFREGDAALRLLPGDPWAFLANPSSKLCGPKYCRAWGTNFCSEHQKIEEE